MQLAFTLKTSLHDLGSHSIYLDPSLFHQGLTEPGPHSAAAIQGTREREACLSHCSIAVKRPYDRDNL